ncbi:MAG: DUF2089 domain-containing protein [Bacillota bacterium]
MKYRMPHRCPVCGHELLISSLTCNHCQTLLKGNFTSCKFCKLPVEQQEFIGVFIKCRGNIKDVERELGISYPTVRNRLDGVIESLGFKVEKAVDGEEKARRQEVLTALENGEITAQDAAKLLRRIGK